MPSSRTIPAHRAGLFAALVAAAATALGAPQAATAAVLTAMPQESVQRPARSFSSAAHGWQPRVDYSGAACVPGLTCPAIDNAYVATGGAGDGGGFLRTSAVGPLATPADSVGTWESPAFTFGDVAAPETVRLVLQRRADVRTLLQFGGEATYSIILLDAADRSRSARLITDAPVTGADAWTPVVVGLSPTLLVPGRGYRLQIRTQMALTAGALVQAVADFDDVALLAGRRTPPQLRSLSARPGGAAAATAATIRGRVATHGLVTTVLAEYGPSTAYGREAASQASPADGDTTFAVKLADLRPHTTYHYRVTATSADGTATTGDRTFRTTAAGPAARRPAGEPPASRRAASLGRAGAPRPLAAARRLRAASDLPGRGARALHHRHASRRSACGGDRHGGDHAARHHRSRPRARGGAAPHVRRAARPAPRHAPLRSWSPCATARVAAPPATRTLRAP